MVDSVPGDVLYCVQEHYVLVLGVVGDQEGWLAEGLRLKHLETLGQDIN